MSTYIFEIYFMIKELIFSILLSYPLAVTGQQPAPIKINNGNDVYADFEKKQVAGLYQLYSLEINTSYDFICGREYFPYYFESELKPILFYGEMHSSQIMIKGITYKEYNLNYDTYKDELIYLDTVNRMAYRPFGMVLNKDYVDKFEFDFINDTLSFSYFSKNSDPGFDLQDGFYEVVYNGNIKYLIKFVPSAIDRGAALEYYYSPVSFINTGKGYVRIRMGYQFIKMFGNRSRDVRKFMARYGIHFRKASKMQIVSVLKYFDNMEQH